MYSPPLEDAAAVSDAFVLDEDDWRQIEFVAAVEKDAVLRELAKLREFKAAQWTGVAWKKVLMRTSRPEALMGRGIRVAALEKAAPAVVGRRPLVLRTMGTMARVRGGFAAELSPGVVLYGHLVDEEVASLSVSSSDPAFEKTPAAPVLVAVRDLLHLELVDWYRSTVVG